MTFGKSFELSSQHILGAETYDDSDSVYHVPLFDLEAEAPPLHPLRYRNTDVIFPFSNDECTAPYFEQLQARVLTREYKEAENRVAIVVGESGLAANLQYIPEETIIVLDRSPDMCIFMQEYIDGLRQAKNEDEWVGRLHAVGPGNVVDFMKYQLAEWTLAGREHPFLNMEEFRIAKKKATDKAIIPWCADLTDAKAMNKLAEALRARNATVTMMNLTNVFPGLSEDWTPADCAAQLGELPMTREAPILTTVLGFSVYQEMVGELTGKKGQANCQTGPFFGLDNLAAAKQDGDPHPLGAIAERRPIEGLQTLYDVIPPEVLALAISALAGRRRQQSEE